MNLTDAFFLIGAYGDPNKSQNPFVLDQGAKCKMVLTLVPFAVGDICK